MTTTTDIAGLPCAVLGAGGFIGVNLCRRLAALGADVRGFGRSNRPPGAPQEVAWTVGEFGDASAVTRAVAGAMVVFHLVGGSLPESSSRDPAADVLSSLLPTLGLLESCRAAAVRKVVFASSGGTVYGIPKATPIPESAPTDPIAAYGVSKLAAEKYLAIYRHLYGLDYTVLRIANPFGPYQSHERPQGIIAAVGRRALLGQPVEIWGDGETVRDFVYIDDVVEAMIAAAVTQSPSRVFNVGEGRGRSINEVVCDIGLVMGRGELPKRHLPGRATDVPVNVLDIGLIGRELAWTPRTEWRQALKWTLDWIDYNS